MIAATLWPMYVYTGAMLGLCGLLYHLATFDPKKKR